MWVGGICIKSLLVVVVVEEGVVVLRHYRLAKAHLVLRVDILLALLGFHHS